MNNKFYIFDFTLILLLKFQPSMPLMKNQQGALAHRTFCTCLDTGLVIHTKYFALELQLILSTLFLARTLPWPLPWNLVPFGSTPFAAKCTICRQFMAHLLCNCKIVCLHLFQILSAANTEVNTMERNASVSELRPLFAAQGCLLTQSQAKNKRGTRHGNGVRRGKRRPGGR